MDVLLSALSTARTAAEKIQQSNGEIEVKVTCLSSLQRAFHLHVCHILSI